MFSILLGTWLTRTIGPNLTGIDLWLSIRKIIIGPEVLPDTELQRNIFFWLSVIIVGILLQGIMTILIFNQRNLLGWIVNTAIWAIIFISSCVLIIGYSAFESGVGLLAISSLITLIGESSIIVGGLSQKQFSHKQSINSATERWAVILEDAIKHVTPFGILAIFTNPQITYIELQQIQNELRGRDLLFPVQNGLFVLLWQNTPANTPLIANKLLDVLQGFTTRSVQIGSACFPEDGNNLKLLLSRAVQALEIAQKTGGSAIIPFSTPKTTTNQPGQSFWESVIQEVRLTNKPAAILVYKTSRPLNLVETHLLQKEIRGRDQVSVVDSGFYVILWNTDRDGAQIVQTKLESILFNNSIGFSVDIVVLPDESSLISGQLKILD